MENEVVLDLTAATMKRRKSSGKRSHQKIRPLAERQRAIELYGTGKTKAEVARTLGIPESTLRGWIKEAKNQGLVMHASSGESSPCSPDSGKSAEQDMIDLSDSNEEVQLVIDLKRKQKPEDGPKDYSIGKAARDNVGLNNNYEKSAEYLAESQNAGEDWRQLLQQAVQQKEDRRRSIAPVPGKRKRKTPTPPALNEWPQAAGPTWQQMQESLAHDPVSLQRLQMHLLQQQMHLMQASPQFQQMMLLAHLQQATSQATTHQEPPPKKRRTSRAKLELQESKENLSTNNSIEILEDRTAPSPVVDTAVKQKRKRRSKANLASDGIPEEIRCFYDPDYFMLQDYLLQQQQIIGERLAMAADSVFID